jgi:hypothetical protein
MLQRKAFEALDRCDQAISKDTVAVAALTAQHSKLTKEECCAAVPSSNRALLVNLHTQVPSEQHTDTDSLTGRYQDDSIGLKPTAPQCFMFATIAAAYHCMDHHTSWCTWVYTLIGCRPATQVTASSAVLSHQPPARMLVLLPCHACTL